MIIPRKDTRILVQGITGKQGTFWTERMQEYGANIVGGVNPKKAGSQHCGVPVYASAQEAAQAGFDASILFIRRSQSKPQRSTPSPQARA